MDQLIIQEKKGPNYFLLQLSGSITSYNFSEYQAKVYDQIKETNLVLDFAEVNFIDSSGIGVLFGAFNDAQEFKHTLYLMRLSLPVQKALLSTGFLDSFTIIQSVTEVV